MKHPCSVRGCERSVPPYLLMCRFHWRWVPRHIQQNVIAAWAAYKADTSGEFACTKALRAAQGEATAAVNALGKRGAA